MEIYPIIEKLLCIFSVYKYFFCFLSRFTTYENTIEVIHIYKSHLFMPYENVINEKLRLYTLNEIFNLPNYTPFLSIDVSLSNNNITQTRFLSNIQVLVENEEYFKLELEYHYFDLIPREKIPSQFQLKLIQFLFIFLFIFNSMNIINDILITKYPIIPFKINLYVLGFLLNVVVGLIYLEYSFITINNDKNTNLYKYLTSLILSFTSIVKYCFISWGKIIDINYDTKAINLKEICDFFKNNLFMDFLVPYLSNIKKAIEKPLFLKRTYKQIIFEIGIFIFLLINKMFVNSISKKINTTIGFLIFSNNGGFTDLIKALELKKDKINKHYLINSFHLGFNLIYFIIRKELIIDDITIIENVLFFVLLSLLYLPQPLPDSYFIDLSIIYADFKVISKNNYKIIIKRNSTFNNKEKEFKESFKVNKPILILNPFFSKEKMNSDKTLNQAQLGYFKKS